MTDLSPALRRAVALFAEPPVRPDVRHGYLDLLGDRPAPPANALQSLWQTGFGSLVYDYGQAVARRVLAVADPPSGALDVIPGEVVLDVGCGPGVVTPRLARAVGPDGLALGLDVSAPMLSRAAREHPPANLGYLRADAGRLPFRPGTVDAVVSLAVLQLVADPAAVVAELARVLRPGGRVTLMYPYWPWAAADVAARVGRGFGVHVFGRSVVPKLLAAQGFRRIRLHRSGPAQWVVAALPAT